MGCCAIKRINTPRVFFIRQNSCFLSVIIPGIDFIYFFIIISSTHFMKRRSGMSLDLYLKLTRFLH